MRIRQVVVRCGKTFSCSHKLSVKSSNCDPESMQTKLSYVGLTANIKGEQEETLKFFTFLFQNGKHISLNAERWYKNGEAVHCPPSLSRIMWTVWHQLVTSDLPGLWLWGPCFRTNVRRILHWHFCSGRRQQINQCSMLSILKFDQWVI